MGRLWDQELLWSQQVTSGDNALPAAGQLQSAGGTLGLCWTLAKWHH